eukprot:283712-Pelagomonas_calceolata.AAC.1
MRDPAPASHRMRLAPELSTVQANTRHKTGTSSCWARLHISKSQGAPAFSTELFPEGSKETHNNTKQQAEPALQVRFIASAGQGHVKGVFKASCIFKVHGH